MPTFADHHRNSNVWRHLPSPRLWGWLAATILFSSVGVRPLQADDSDVARKRGPLMNAGPVIQHLYEGRVENDRLTFDLIELPEEAESYLDSIDGAVGSGGFSHYNERQWELVYGDATLSFSIRQRAGRRDERWQEVQCTERVAPFRSMMLRTSNTGEVFLELAGSRHPYLFRFYQDEGGRCLVQEIDATEVATAESENLVALIKRYPEFSGGRLLPCLNTMGVGGLSTPYNPEVIRVMRMACQPLSETDLEKVGPLLAGLDSEFYAQRQDATAQLSYLWGKDSELVLRLAMHPELKTEARRRVRNAIQEVGNEGQFALAAMDFVEAQQLFKQSDYLRWLIEREESEAIRLALEKHLAELVPTDSQAAEAPAVESAPENRVVDAADATTPVPLQRSIDDRLGSSSGLVSAAPHVARLVRLTVLDGRLTLDRDHWAEQFNHKSIRELVAESRAFMRDAHLPEQWFQPPDHNDFSLDYPPVIFQSIKEKLHMQQDDYYGWQQWDPDGEGQGWADALESRRLKMVLQWAHESNSGLLGMILPTLTRSFQLQVVEKTNRQQQLIVESGVDGRMLIRVSCPQDRWISQLLQMADGQVIYHDLQAAQASTYKATSFQQLVDQHGDVLQRDWFPMLDRLGIKQK